VQAVHVHLAVHHLVAIIFSVAVQQDTSALVKYVFNFEAWRFLTMSSKLQNYISNARFCFYHQVKQGKRTVNLSVEPFGLCSLNLDFG
jgi:hypothetical protein